MARKRQHTRVVNVRFEACEVYCGRPRRGSSRPTWKDAPFGNPYVIGKDGDREEVIRLYRKEFKRRIKSDPEFKFLVDGIRGKTLGCFCRPKRGFQGQLLCHVQIIAAYLDGIKPEEVE